MQTEHVDFSNKLSSRAIYNSENLSRYVWLLIVCKIFCCSCLFIAYDAVRTVHIIHFIWLITAICSLLFCVVHRPFQGKKPFTIGTWGKIVKLSLLQIFSVVLLFYGLSQVGPYRTALLTEHSDVVILAVLSAVLKGRGGPGKLRGSLWFVLAILSLVLFDNDSESSRLEHPEGHIHYGFRHFIFNVFSWMGLSDHEGGILILLLATLLMTALKYQSLYLAIEVGGTKMLNCLSWLVAFVILSPISFILAVMKVSSVLDMFSVMFHAFIVAFFYFVSNFYISIACSNRLTSARSACIGTIAMILSSFLLSFLWTSTASTNHPNTSFHKLSGGSVFSLIMFVIATIQLTSTKDFLSLDFERDGLLPFYDISVDGIQNPHPIVTVISSTLQQVLSDRNSRLIFYFLCVNLGFTFVELMYGMWTNSLGLISDGFHMLFDCSSLVMGLCASVMAHWKPTKQFPFGYGRIEVLSGFVNGLFLSVIGFMIFTEAVERLFEPPHIDTERLLAVAVCGLVVNLCGIFAFSSHSHGGQHFHHGHSHTESLHHHSHNANMEGVFLHIVADTLGSVAVIISSLLIEWYGWLIADPICSLILSILILISVIPLLKNSTKVLLLSVPLGMQDGCKHVIKKILELESVLACQNPHMWQHCDNMTIATVKVQVTGIIPEQKIIEQVTSVLQEFGFSQITVQVEVVHDVSSCYLSPSMWELGSVIKTLPAQDENFYSIREI